MAHCIQARYVVVCMVFFGTWTSYMLRTNISIAIVAMTKQRTALIWTHPACRDSSYYEHDDSTGKNKTWDHVYWGNYWERSSCEGRTDLYDWSGLEQAHIFAAYFFGYILTSLPGRWFSRKYGARWIVGCSTLAAGILTILVPIIADFHLVALIVTRGFTGFAAGFMFPGMHTCITLWAPPGERKAFVWGLLGGTLGTAINWPFCALIIKYLSWEMVFYITGTLGVVWSLCWMVFVFDSPMKHPCISKEEREYITSSIGHTTFPARERKVPWCKVLSSPPILCLMFLHFCNMWNLNFLLIELPTYFIQVLGYVYVKAALLASVPYFCRLILGLFFSALINFIIYEKQLLSVIVTRKIFTFLSHCLPGILLLVIAFVDCDAALIVTLITLAMALNAAAVGGVLANAYDLTPNHASKIFNMVNCMTMLSGIIVAEIVGLLTNDEETIKDWQIVMTINAALYLASGILFLIFASAQVQSWNELGEDQSEEEARQSRPRGPAPQNSQTLNPSRM